MEESHSARASTLARALAAWALLLLLVACGGGGDGAAAVSSELPQTLVVTTPATQQALGTAVAFSSNAVDPGNVLSFRWDFGDGTSSAGAAPSHVYAKAGVFTVRLTLSDEAGRSLASSASVAIADFAIVAGKACSGAGGTGWCWQRPLPQGNTILDYAFIDDSHGWAVGEGGTVLASVDGGVTWNAQVSGTGLDLGRVSFTNAQVGWIASSYGEVLKTADGGASWQRVSFGQNEPVQSIASSDASHAWITTYYGTAYVTRDGGTQWSRIVARPGGFKLALVSGSDVWSLPYYNDGTVPLGHSLDGGATWTDVAMPPLAPGFASSPQDLQFVDASNGLLVGTEFGFDDSTQSYVSRDAIWRTTDRGASWQALLPPPGNASGNAYRLIDATTVFVSSPYGTPLQRSSDGGASWQAIPMPTVMNTYLAGYQVFSAQRLMVKDGNGSTYLTLDGGATWNPRSAGGAASTGLNSVWFFDSREGLAFAWDGSSVRTTDGGQTWVASAPVSPYGWRRGQFLADASLGWVISDTGTIYRSSDKGRTWVAPVAQTSVALNGVTDFHFIDALHGWAVSPYGSIGQAALYASSDGGLTWGAIGTDNAVSGLVSIRFGDALHGAAVGPPGIAIFTADGGSTWSPRPTGSGAGLRRIAFVDAATAVAVGDFGAIVRSVDQGRTWTPVASPTANNLNDVRFVSATIGHAVGDNGTVLITRDAGLTWTLAGTGSRPGLQGVFFVDEQTGWVAGDNGSIMATASGGR
ncbi:MAG: YCF48-related protein [Caldimonas sp.]